MPGLIYTFILIVFIGCFLSQASLHQSLIYIMLNVFKSLVVCECDLTFTLLILSQEPINHCIYGLLAKFVFYSRTNWREFFAHEAYLVLVFGEEAPHKRIRPVYFHKPENTLNRARG